MESGLEFRYERKYILPRFYERELYSLLKLNNLFFHKRYQDRKVRSLYFEDLDYSTFYENINGLSRRNKYRVRWYGNTFDKVFNGKFEIKSKRNKTNSKKSWPLESFQIAEDDNVRKLFEKIIKATSSIEAKNIISQLRPIVFTEYYRSYYETKCSSIRATVDSQLSFRKASNVSISSDVYDYIILEIKYSTEKEKFFNDLSAQLPLRAYRMSKYVNALNLLSIV